jgi:heme A synthase
MTTPTQRPAVEQTGATPPGMTLYRVFVGLAALGILLQGLWAGVFIRPGQDYDSTWVFVHARGAEVTIACALIATAVVFWKMRARRDLLVGTGALVLLLAFEAYIGGEIFPNAGLTALHIPLALALMALAVWLPLRSRR